MDPVKEKLNLLKKLASEKKSTNQSNLTSCDLPDITDNKKSTNLLLNNNDLKLCNNQHLCLSEAPVQILENGGDDLSFSLQNENKKEEEEDFPIEENSGSLIVFDDTDKLESSESNMDIKMLAMRSELNSNYRLNMNNPSNVKSQLQSNKSFTINQQQQQQQPEPSSKYINRIRDLYDKERASSIESMHHLKLKNQRQNSSIKKLNEVFTRDRILTPQNSLQSEIMDKSEKSAPLASPEVLLEPSLNESDQEDPSIISSVTGSVSQNAPHRSKSYIAHLRNTFNSQSLRSDSIEIAKRNSYVPESNNQIEKIKEKFTKVNQVNHRNSFMHPAEMNKMNSHYKSLRSLKSEDQESTKVEQLVKNMNEEANKQVDKPSKKTTHKYQKSMTSDLSSFIIEREREIEHRKQAESKTLEDYDKKLIDKYSTDVKYSAENAIIRSSLNKDSSDQQSFNLKNDQVMNLINEESNKLKVPGLQLNNTPVTPIMKRTKSILKSPSSFCEKTIQFDDKVDIIPIDRVSDDASPSPFESTSFDRTYENANEFLNYSNFRPTIKKSNELEFLRKNYENYDNFPRDYLHELSPFKNRQNIEVNRERIFIKSPTPTREIYDSPINPPSNELPSSSFTYLSINGEENSNDKNRNRFAKRTNQASLRSQSADLSKFVNSSPKNNFALDSSLLPRDRPIPIPITRPNLTRQNALQKSFAKSLAEGIDKAHLPKDKKHRHKKHHHRSRRTNRKNKRASSLTSSSSDINSSEISEGSSSFSSSSSYDALFDRNRISNDKKNKTRILTNLRPGKKLQRHTFYSSDDSVCGIPKSSAKLAQKSSRLCTSSKQFHKSMDDLNYERDLAGSSFSINKSNKNQIDKSNYEKFPVDMKDSTKTGNAEPKLTSSRHSLLVKDEIEPKNTGSMKSELSNNSLGQNRKPLPSYSEVIQSKLNDPNKNRNSVVFNYQQYSSQLLNNQANTISEVKNQRPVQQIVYTPQQINKPQSQHVSKIAQHNNQLNFQQSRSKSLDASLCVDLPNQKSDEYQDFNDDHLIMPYQSAAIQERLKQFEQNGITNENQIKKKVHLPIQESRTESIDFVRKRNPLETQNKENSPNPMISQRHSTYQPIAITQNFISNKNDAMLKHNLTNLNATKSASNINLVKVSNQPKPVFNPNLSAATAAAAAAIEQQHKPENINRIHQFDTNRKEGSVERLDKHETKHEPVNLKTIVSVNGKTSNGQNEYTNVLKRALNFEQKNEQVVSKSSTPLASDTNSSMPSSRRNSPLKSVSKTAISLSPLGNEDVEMVSTSSSTSNKENKSDSNELSNEPSKLSISEKLKLFSGSNANTANSNNNSGQNSVTFTTLNMSQTKKINQTPSASKINFNKSQLGANEANKLSSNLIATKSFNYIDKAAVLKENINKNNNSDENSQSIKNSESLAAIKSKFESSKHDHTDDFEDFFKSKPLLKRGIRFKSLKFEPNLDRKVKPNSIQKNFFHSSLIDTKPPRPISIFDLNNNKKSVKKVINKETPDNGANMTEDNTDNQNSDTQFSIKEAKRNKPTKKMDEERTSDGKESSPLNIGMTIQERMAALKKNGEEDWKKRSVFNPTEEKQTTGSNLVKQQQENLKQQLNNINTKSSSNMKHNVLIPFLNEMKATQKHENLSDEESSVKKNKISQSNESLDILMSHNQIILDEKPPRRVDADRKRSPVKQSKLTRMHSAGSDTDSMLARNTMVISKPNTNKFKPEKVELFSTDSEMDSFFKDDVILNKNVLSSNSSGNKTDDNTMDENIDDEFDQIVSDAKRLTQETRARPHRKTKSKGNHLKNLQNRIEIKNEYEQKHVPIVVDELTEEQQRQIQEQAALVSEITRMNRFNKN